MAQEIFRRYEKKYLLTYGQRDALLAALDGRMRIDRYGRHTICNIYYDTEDYQLIRASLEKPVYKEKLRLRSYGVPGSEDHVFLEIKKKYKGIVYKRRIELPLHEAEDYMRDKGRPSQESQILHEIDWFRKLYRGLKPMVYIAYDRVALYGLENADLRLTLDENIRFRTDDLQLSSGADGRQILPEGRVLMELKIPEAMPIWMGELLDELQIYPASFSKYGTAYSEFILPEQRKGMIQSA